MKHFRVIKDVAMIGGIGAMVAFVLQGCDNNQNSNADTKNLSQSINQGAYVLLEEQNDGSYKILEEYPSSSTHIVVRDKTGHERLLNKEEVDDLIKKEEQKLENNTSSLTSGDGGLGLGGAILASAAGAILGSYIGNKLFNNPAYQQAKQRTYKSPQAYERSQNSFKNTQASTAAKGTSAKSGFFKSSGASQSAGG